MEWWIWILLGLLLLLAELVTPGGFYFIFFGSGAVVVGVLAGLGIGGPVWFQILLFSILSLVSLWLFREKLLKLTEQAPDMKIDSLVGETAVANDEIPVNGIGKVELRGDGVECPQHRRPAAEKRRARQSGARRRAHAFCAAGK